MRAIRFAVALLFLLLPLARADRVTLPDKIELSGKKVEILEVRDQEILVRVAYGEITIPRERVVGMEVDFATRLDALKKEGKDVPRALDALGRVCDAVEMPKEAVQAYRMALAGKDIPDDVLLPMAAQLEKHEAWRDALACYRAYLKAAPNDTEAQEKAKTAAAKASEQPPEVAVSAPAVPGKIDIATASVPGTPQVAVVPAEPLPAEPRAVEPKTAEPKTAEPKVEEPKVAAPQPAEPKAEEAKVVEGLEVDGGWSTEPWGSTVEVSVAVPEGGTNDKMLRALLAGAEKDKTCLMLEQDFDLTKKKSLIFDVHNYTGQSLQIAVAFITRPNWEFFESIPVTALPTGKEARTFTIDLTSERFKSEASKWRYKTPIGNRAGIIKLYFLLYTKVTGKWVYFNNIRFDPPDEPKVPGVPAAAPAAAPAEPKAAPAEPKNPAGEPKPAAEEAKPAAERPQPAAKEPAPVPAEPNGKPKPEPAQAK